MPGMPGMMDEDEFGVFFGAPTGLAPQATILPLPKRKQPVNNNTNEPYGITYYYLASPGRPCDTSPRFATHSRKDGSWQGRQGHR